jgi:hypothetical protein
MSSSGFLSKKTTQERFNSESDNAISSNLEGNTVSIQAGNDIRLTGTNAVSDRGTQLTAGGDIDILAAQNTSSESSSTQVKKSGLFSNGGASFTVGKQQTDDSNAKTSLILAATSVRLMVTSLLMLDATINRQAATSSQEWALTLVQTFKMLIAATPSSVPKASILTVPKTSIPIKASKSLSKVVSPLPFPIVSLIALRALTV